LARVPHTLCHKKEAKHKKLNRGRTGGDRQSNGTGTFVQTLPGHTWAKCTYNNNLPGQ